MANDTINITLNATNTTNTTNDTNITNITNATNTTNTTNPISMAENSIMLPYALSPFMQKLNQTNYAAIEAFNSPSTKSAL